jgi:hypothetical protein
VVLRESYLRLGARSTLIYADPFSVQVLRAQCSYTYYLFKDMTTLLLSQIPSNIATVEQLVFWGTSILRDMNPGRDVVEGENQLPAFVASLPIYESPKSGILATARCTLTMDPAYSSDRSKKLWMFAKELSVNNIPATYLSN